MFKLEQATKTRRKLRAALYGPSGSGKTYTALRIASGLGGKIGVIDTEHGSASIYADRFNFVVGELHGADRNIDNYCAAMQACAAAGVEVLIIDSLSHAWQELLDEVDRVAKSARFNGNKWSAWSEGTPKQKQLVEMILSYPGHVIVTMRSKTEWTTEQTDKGKTKPVRIGLAPEQGKGIEYEFDLLMELSQDHVATVIKDRSGQWQDKALDKPDEKTGKALADWLASAPVSEPEKPAPAPPKPTPAINANGDGPKAPSSNGKPPAWREALEKGVDNNMELFPLAEGETRAMRLRWLQSCLVERLIEKAQIAEGIYPDEIPDALNAVAKRDTRRYNATVTALANVQPRLVETVA